MPGMLLMRRSGSLTASERRWEYQEQSWRERDEEEDRRRGGMGGGQRRRSRDERRNRDKRRRGKDERRIERGCGASEQC